MTDDLGSAFTPEELEQIKSDPDLRRLIANVSASDFPDSPIKDSLLKLFRDVLALDDADYNKISKVGNLKEFEVGNLAMTTRGYLSLAQYTSTERLDNVSAYLRGQSNIVLNTSLSRAAQFLKLIVTQRKFTGIIEPKRVETKGGIFGSKTVESGGDD